jgi:hypothetical protein
MPVQFEDFTTLPALVFSNELQPSSFDLVDEVWIDFVSVTMTFIDGIMATVESLCNAIINLEDGWT